MYYSGLSNLVISCILLNIIKYFNQIKINIKIYIFVSEIDNENLVDQIIKNGTNVNIRYGDGKTLLHISSSTGKNKKWKSSTILKTKEDASIFEIVAIEVSINWLNWIIFVLSGNEKMSEYLMKHGLNISTVDDHGNTPLHYASMAGKKKFVYCNNVQKNIISIKYFFRKRKNC